MRDLTVLPQSEAKLRLLESAELLFAERGFEVVSVRDITQHAKANVAAINYHFGTREGLVAVVVARHLAPVNEERLARLELLERKWSGKVVPVEEVIDAWVRPLLGAVRKSELPEWLCCRLLGRISTMHGPGLPAGIDEQASQLGERFTRVLGKGLVGVAPEDLVWRSHFVVGAMIHMLMHQDLVQRSGNGPAAGSTMEATLGRFIRFAAAGMREGLAPLEAAVKKGPQAMFDF